MTSRKKWLYCFLMRHGLTFLVLVLGLGSIAAGQTDTALDSLKLLPEGAAARLAKIEARDGTPGPERWYFIVYDGSDQNGVHEYVVAGEALVASRAISQFAETVKPAEVTGTAGLKVDSDQLEKLAQDYAEANQMSIAKIGYELKKDEGAAPVWKVTCQDDEGKTFASLTLSATDAAILSHQGFAASPPEPVGAPAESGTAAIAENHPSATPEVKATPVRRRRPRVTGTDSGNDAARHDEGIGGTFRHVGGSLEKFFTGHNSNGQ